MIKRTYLGLIYFFLYAPIAVLLVFSFNNARYSQVWHGFTWHWYADLAHDHTIISVAFNSLLVAVSASTLACMLGTLAAVSLYRYRFMGRKFIYALVFALITLPDIVLGIALLVSFNLIHIPLGFISILLGHIAICMPFVIITIYTRLQHIDPNLFNAAHDLGASDFIILKKIIIPLLGSAFLAAWLLGFTLSLDDLMISFFVAGPTFEVLPLQLFGMVKVGASPELNALCSIMFVLTLSLVVVAERLLHNDLKQEL